jgi:hypothetical protein
MNERIKQLQFQAAAQIPPLLVASEWQQEFTKKFAELIVKECLKIVEPTEDSGDEWCVTLKGTAQEIKEHFGVEE